MRGFAQTFSAAERRRRDFEDDLRGSRIRIAIVRFRFRPAQQNSRFRFRGGAENNSEDRLAAIRRHATDGVPLLATANSEKHTGRTRRPVAGAEKRTGRDQ